MRHKYLSSGSRVLKILGGSESMGWDEGSCGKVGPLPMLGLGVAPTKNFEYFWPNYCILVHFRSEELFYSSNNKIFHGLLGGQKYSLDSYL